MTPTRDRPTNPPHNPKDPLTMLTMKYRIIRHYLDTGSKRTINKGLTLEEAQAHCNDPETSSSTCTNPANLARTRKLGQWFDGYSESH